MKHRLFEINQNKLTELDQEAKSNEKPQQNKLAGRGFQCCTCSECWDEYRACMTLTSKQT